MKTCIRLVMLCVLGLVLASCATTSVLSTWRKPDLQRFAFKKVLVMVPAKDEALRREVEDELVAELLPTAAVPSYTLLPEGASIDALREAGKRGDFDGALVMQVTAVDKQATWVPTAYGYGGWGWYDAGYTRIDTYVRVETKIYSLPSEDLLWAASTRTINPSGTRALVREVSSTLRSQLTKENLIAPRESGAQ
jgi:hypothetical protein